MSRQEVKEEEEEKLALAATAAMSRLCLREVKYFHPGDDGRQRKEVHAESEVEN